MAATPATITVTFTSNYAGLHRICWRIGSSAAYDCTTTVTCDGGGATCSEDITVSVDNETCDDVTFEGYVQAACEDINSTSGRIPFSVTFTPSPVCLRYEVTCLNAGVESITITEPGTGYDPLDPPAVAITGGGGSGATADATVGDGAILTNTISVAGAGYTNGVYGACPLTGGSGSGAQATVTISGTAVTSVIITAPGSGYLDTDILAPDTAVVGVPGVPAQITITTDYGIIIDITVTDPGSSYETVPTVTIDDPVSGTTAEATAELEPCPDFDIEDCDGVPSPSVLVDNVEVGDMVAICSEDGTPVMPSPSQFDVTQDGTCLCDCENVTITNTSSQQSGAVLRITYIECGGTYILRSLPAQTGISVCVVTDSINITSNNPAATWTEVVNGTCQAS
jgi:hypothetical protein